MKKVVFLAAGLCTAPRVLVCATWGRPW